MVQEIIEWTLNSPSIGFRTKLLPQANHSYSSIRRLNGHWSLNRSSIRLNFIIYCTSSSLAPSCRLFPLIRDQIDILFPLLFQDQVTNSSSSLDLVRHPVGRLIKLSGTLIPHHNIDNCNIRSSSTSSTCSFISSSSRTCKNGQSVSSSSSSTSCHCCVSSVYDTWSVDCVWEVGRWLYSDQDKQLILLFVTFLLLLLLHLPCLMVKSCPLHLSTTECVTSIIFLATWPLSSRWGGWRRICVV